MRTGPSTRWRRSTSSVVAIGLVGAVARADDPADTTPKPERQPYKMLRFDEDWTFLRDPSLRTDPFDPLKFVPLNAGGSAWLSFGGSVREVYESYHHPGFSDDPESDSYLMSRALFHADAHATDWLRGFGEIQDSRVHGRSTPPRPTDEDHVDLHQAFGELVGTADDEVPWFVRVGRQEMQFGSSRLVSVRDGPNVRLSFDAARVGIADGDWSIDAFAGRPVETDTHHVFDDGADKDRALWGVYAGLPKTSVVPGRVEAYWFGYQNDDAEFVQGTGHERRQSLGSRWYGTSEAWDFNFEGVGQWGDFAGRQIRAWTLASDTGYTLRGTPLTPRLGLKANYISGDHDAHDDRLGTFNAMFPRGSYFGDIGIVGPANLFNLHPSVETHLTRDVTLTADCVFYWRASTDDGVYNPGGAIIRAPGGSDERYIGTQPSLILSWRVDPHLTIAATYTRFQAGPFLEDTGPHHDIDYVRVEATFRF